MRNPWPGRAGIGIAILALAAAAVWALQEEPAQVDVATAAAGPMQVTIREDGMTRVRDVYAVSAPIAGRMSRTLLKEGDQVEGGATVVAAIHPLDPALIDRRTEAELAAARNAARSAVGIAESEMKRAETLLSQAEQELARATRLHGPGYIPESVLDKLASDVALQEAAVETARATIAFRQAELESAEARLLGPGEDDPGSDSCCVNLLAPISGRVLAVHARSEQPVAAGALVAEIGDTSKLEVVVELLSADAVRIAPGTQASLVEWGGDEALPARVRTIDPAAHTKVSALGIEEQRVNVVLDLDGHDPRLGHGYRVVAILSVWQCEACLQVPISALFRAGRGWRTFRLVDGRLRQTDVAIGQMNDESAQVLDGLTVGDIVVLHPSDTLGDGDAAQVRR